MKGIRVIVENENSRMRGTVQYCERRGCAGTEETTSESRKTIASSIAGEGRADR